MPGARAHAEAMNNALADRAAAQPGPMRLDDDDNPAEHAPIEAEAEPPSVEIGGALGTEGRYDLMESVSFAFLLALEALTPQQRAVLLLRDVFDYSVEESARVLGLSEANVKTTHHRARKALAPYEAQRCRPSPALIARSGEALQRFRRFEVKHVPREQNALADAQANQAIDQGAAAAAM